jgi:hypothetical protein
MLTLDLEEFMFELKDGAIKHVGPSNQTATAKLYDVTETEARAFGDDRIKLAFEDEAGSQVEVALPPAAAQSLAAEVDAIPTGD